MRAILFAALFVSTSAALAGSAFAGPSTNEPACPQPPEATPAFVLMDNTGDGSKLDLTVAGIIPPHASNVEDVLFRHSISGQYVAPNGFGGYAGMSMAMVMGTDSEAVWGTGNLEMGGLFQRALTPSFDLGVRVGVVVPTARQEVALALLSTLIARPADIVTALPDTTAVRVGISPTYHRGVFFARADLGLDVAATEGEEKHGIGHVNAGVGIFHYGLIATAEMQTVFLASQLGDGESSFFRIGGLSARYQTKWVSPFVSVSAPLERDLLGDLVTATAGLTVSL